MYGSNKINCVKTTTSKFTVFAIDMMLSQSSLMNLTSEYNVNE